LPDRSEHIWTVKAERWAIDKKARALGATSDTVHAGRLVQALYDFVGQLQAARFGAVIVDYDGTVVDTECRFIGLSEPVAAALVRLLECGLLLGVATGRGKSVRIDLERCIPDVLRPQVWIGYYNAGVIACLSDSSKPAQSDKVTESLREAFDVLEHEGRLHRVAKITKRFSQITIEATQELEQGTLWEIVSSALAERCSEPPRVVASSHSVDVLATGVSKRNMIHLLQGELTSDHGRDVLCIGDRGRWPGNDFELLAQPYSLSVDEVSADLATCWNLSSPGKRGSAAFLEYTDWMQLAPKAAHIIVPAEPS
jgi:hydroxymethylpyrimidine pyrophosphatase-like HAD family hydrolase